MILATVLGVFPAKAQYSQPSGNDTILLSATVVGSDTLPVITLEEILVQAPWPRALAKRMMEWTRLRNAVYVTYPYALAAARILRDVNFRLAALPSKKQKKAFLKMKEKELKAEFGNKLENLSMYQGEILMKLISRQTGENCYSIIKKMKGGFSARLWQTVAFFFGSDLKSNYNLQQDRDIETIVLEIEARQGRYN
ncbi:MAG: DUF4294 domain-containing protein [Chitinophagaceae bacterium]